MKIMIVDDEPVILMGLSNIIKKNFNNTEQIVKANDGIDALKKIEKCIPDVIITDIQMPEMDGLDLMKKITEKNIYTKFIILTSYAEFEYAKKAIQYKATEYLLKPINKEKLIRQLIKIEKDINKEKENFIKRELQIIKETMLYGEECEESLLDDKVINEIFSRRNNNVIVIQTDKKEVKFQNKVKQEFKNTFLNSYMFELPYVNELIFLNNYDRSILKEEYDELYNRCKKLYSGEIYIGISQETEKLGRVHDLYLNALESLYIDKYFPFEKENQISSSFKKSKLGYEDIENILKKKGKEDRIIAINEYIMNISKNNEDGNNDNVYKIIIANIASYLQIIDKETKEIIKTDDVITDNNLKKNEIIKNIENIFSKIEKMFAEKKEEKEKRYSKSVDKILGIVNKRYNDDISMEEVADEINLHPNYASTIFKNEIGTSFIKYLNSYRILKAKAYIKKNPDMIFENIANRVGYVNNEYFYKVFKKYCGLTPGEYREKVIKED